MSNFIGNKWARRAIIAAGGADFSLALMAQQCPICFKPQNLPQKTLLPYLGFGKKPKETCTCALTGITRVVEAHAKMHRSVSGFRAVFHDAQRYCRYCRTLTDAQQAATALDEAQIQLDLEISAIHPDDVCGKGNQLFLEAEEKLEQAAEKLDRGKSALARLMDAVSAASEVEQFSVWTTHGFDVKSFTVLKTALQLQPGDNPVRVMHDKYACQVEPKDIQSRRLETLAGLYRPRKTLEQLAEDWKTAAETLEQLASEVVVPT